MGILSAFRKVTGGSAEVDLLIENTKRGEKAKVTVAVHVGSDTLKVKRVYLKLRASEVIDLPNYHAPLRGGQSGSSYIDVRSSSELFEKEYVVAEGREIAAGSGEEFRIEIDIPANALPTFTGKHARIEWQALAGLDVAWATDPSSGWQHLVVT